VVNCVQAQFAQTGGTYVPPQTFPTAQDAAAALIDAAEKVDTAGFEKIFGSPGKKIVSTGEPGRDKELTAEFAAKAREQNKISIDPKDPGRAVLLVGKDDWPFPAPIVESKGHWSFDPKAGEREIVYRRVGRNELDAIEICRGYVEAQHAYALMPRKGYDVNQYAQRIISSPGRQDGLAWRNADGSWGGPVGINAAKAFAHGYQLTDPYHGYFFKVLKGQGPAAPLGQMDFVVKGVMIGGFALVAAPARYGVTGIKTFMVSHDGVVYERDLGAETLKRFEAMTRFNPEPAWTPVKDQ
jgi:hypothetical protein